MLPSGYLPTFSLNHIVTFEYDFLPKTARLLHLEQVAECVELVREFVRPVNLL